MSAHPPGWRGFPTRTFGTAARAVVAMTLLLAALALPAGAETDGPAQEILAVTADLEPIAEPCYLSTCPPPRYAYGALPARFVPLGERVFFVADDRVHGAEPWVSDGTADGTAMLQDLCPGECASVPTPLGTLNGEVLFWAHTPDFGVELWASDGTSAGTRRLTDLCPGTCGGYHQLTPWWNDEVDYHLSRLAGAVLDGELFFGAFDGAGSGLFASDGTAAGTRLVARTCDHLCTTVPVGLSRIGDHLAFLSGESELWWSDGTPAGSRRGPAQCAEGHLTEISLDLLSFAGRAVFAGGCGGTFGTRPSQFDLYVAEPYGAPVSLARGPAVPVAAVHDGAVWAVFPQPGAQPAAELWRSDGTPAGSSRVATFDLPPALGLTSLAGHLLLTTYDPPSYPTGYRVDLWQLDGAAPPHRLNDGSLSLAAPRALGDRVLWWETPGFVDSLAQVFDWRLVDYGENLDGSDERRQVQLYRSPAVGPDFAPKQRIYPAFAAAGGHLFLSADGGDGQQLWRLPLAALPPVCGDDPHALCLRDQRFRVKVRFFNQHAGGAEGQATPDAGSRLFGGDTGYLWFFRPDNLELAVKVLDGRPVNGHFWVFAGGTTDLEYEVEVLDLHTDRRRTYRHAPGDLCAVVDTRAFAMQGTAGQVTAGQVTAGQSTTHAAAPLTPPLPPQCDFFGGRSACLGAGDRFQVEVDFRNQYAGGAPGVGQPYPETRDTATVRFFPHAGTELLVKVLDGRPVNGHFWVLWGGLTTLEYELRVRDLEADVLRTYRNPPESRCGGADLTAF